MGEKCILFPVTLLLLLLLNYFTVCLATTDDQISLLAFKANLIDQAAILSTSWSTNTSTCNWLGITCDMSTQRVTSLNLSHMGLTGTISPHLGNLSFLTSLDISHNAFHGYIPKELAHLQNLQHLHLFNNNLTATIPTSFGTFSKLETLNIGHNYLGGNIPQEIGNLSMLKVLDLRFNHFTGSLPALIFNLSLLTVIDLSTNSLSDSLPVDMCSHVPKLERLNLSSNILEGQIPSNIYNCTSLRYLSLASNEFNGSIPREIGRLSMLNHLFLGNNNLRGVIPLEMGNLKILEQLRIPSNSLTGPIPNVMFNISSLKIIDLRRNSLSGSLPLDIHYDLPVLEELYLYSNQLTGQIPSRIWELRGLRILALAANEFTGSIPKKVGNLTLLTDLYVSDNNLTGTLPDEIGTLNLETLLVDGNMLSGSIPFNIFNISTIVSLGLQFNHFSGHLPVSMGLWLPSLERLYLGNNRIGGIIPSSISNASKLTIIEMASNSLTGFIPNTLGNLRDLQWLIIGENNLTGEFSTPELRFFNSLTNCRHLEMLGLSLNQFNAILPTSVGNLSTSLQLFEAFGCKIKGEIPIGIGNLSSLESIVLDSNELTGFIPSTLGRLNRLEGLYLEHNRLQGPIPIELCMLEKMADLYLSDNKLYGPIPPCLGELQSMRRLYLDSNKLTLTIPSTLWSLRDLLYLNLSSNTLSGNLPAEIGNLKVITQMDFSCNLLSGDIPNTIGSAQMLTSLSLANNKLQGSIPQSLSNLINLELLDLSHNNLSGVISKSFESLRYLQYFNVSFNNLKGEIPIGGQFGNFTAQSFMQNDALCGPPRLQVQQCKIKTLQRSSSRTSSLLKYILPPTITIILAIALLLVCISHRKRNTELLIQLNSLPHSWRKISYAELLQVTNEFSESNLLGVGSVGSVYKGTFSDGMHIAVKVFNLQVEEAFKSFDAECDVLRNIRHRNLIKIISSCTNVDFLALVLEYMPNGSLEKWLYSHNYCLDILQRLNIMIDVASALEYLHHGYTTSIVHCDLKPSNVLLDNDMIAHVCDFGISKLLGERELMAQTKTLATIGYMAPEYGMEGIVSTRGDVYSYGVLLMETFTRKKPTDEMFSDKLSLRSWICEASHGSIFQVVDSNLIRIDDGHLSAKQQCASSILGLALDCSKNSPTERINMEDVVVRLRKIKMTLLENVGRVP